MAQKLEESFLSLKPQHLRYILLKYFIKLV